MLVIDHQVPQTKSSDSKELEPAAHHLYRVKEVQPKNLRLISIIDGTERSLPYELVKPMSMPDLMEMKFNLNHLYLNSHFNRLLKNNKFIGPDAAKTWRRLTMKNQEIEVDHPENDAQESDTNKGVEAPPDPDMMRRVTRSGAALLASVVPSNSILKLVAYNPDYDMAIISSYTPNSLGALKVGINSQDRKTLTSIEKNILSIEYEDLIPPLSFQSETIPNKSGKKVVFDEKIEIWSPDENKFLYSDLNDQIIYKSQTIPVNYIQFMDLDFLVHELYTACSDIYNE